MEIFNEFMVFYSIYEIAVAISFFIAVLLFGVIFGFAAFLANLFGDERCYTDRLLMFGGFNMQGISLLLGYLLDDNIFLTQGTQLEGMLRFVAGAFTVGGAIFVIFGILGLTRKHFRDY